MKEEHEGGGEEVKLCSMDEPLKGKMTKRGNL